MVFDVDQLEELVKRYLPECLTVRDVGRKFGFDDNSSWSLYRSGKRQLTTHIIATCIELFPNVPTSSYTRNVPRRIES